jgi:hypothetical protein
MRYRILLATAAAALLVGLVPSPAGAQLVQSDDDAQTIAATITAGGIGSRTIVALPVVMSSALGQGSVSGLYSVSVVELAATGRNPWQVTTTVSELTSAVDSTKIAPERFSITSPTVVATLPAGTDTPFAAGSFTGTGAVSAARTLWDNADQSTTAVYTSTHTATGTLSVSPPNAATTGLYNGTVTYTLFT